MAGMFYRCSSFINLNLNNLNTSNVTDMGYMFEGCSSITSLNLSNFDTSNVTDMEDMFEGCSSITNLDLSNFDTSNVTDMGYMFYGCSSFISLDLNSFDTSNVTDMGCMFYGCSNLTSLDLSTLDTSEVINMMGIFEKCNSLMSLDLSNFDMSKVTAYSGTHMDVNISTENMFEGCDNCKSINTPKNVKVLIKLPSNSTDIWYRSDGTVVTELPQNLSYSVALGKNYIPTEKQPDLAESAVIELKDGESAIFVYDTSINAPIEGASVIIDNKSYSTNSEGIATFTASNETVKKQITVKASNYSDVITYRQIKNKNLIRIGMEPSTGSIQVTSATASLGDKKFDLLREKYVLGYAESLDNFSNLTKDTLTLEITANKPNVTYELIATDKSIWTTPDKTANVQTTSRASTGSGGGGGSSWGDFEFSDEDILFTNTDGKFSIEVGTETVKIGTVALEQTAVITILHPTENMYIRITDNEDHCVVKKLNLFTTHNYLTQEKTSQKDSFQLGKELRVSVPEDVPFIGGGEYTFGFSDKMPVEMEIDEDGKIRIALNKRTDTKMEDFGRVYKDMEDAYKRMDKTTLNAINFSGVKSFDAALLKISGKVCGYGEGNINEIVNGNPVIELGVMAELEGKIGYQQRWVIGVVPIKIFVEASAKGSVDFRTDVKFENWRIKDLDFTDGSFNIKVGLEAGAGVGCSYVYELEVSVNGSLNYINKPGRKYQKIWLEASGKVQRTALYFFEKPLWQSDTYTHTLYEQGRDKARSNVISQIQNAESPAQESSFRIMDRNYLNYTTGYHTLTDASQLASHVLEEENKNITIKSAVLPTTKSTLIDTANGRYLFWADDIASRDNYNRSALMYAKSTNGTDWSTPKQLLPEAEDATLDGYYSVFAEGNNIHILWQDATRQITEEDDMLDILNALSVRHVALDTESDVMIKDECVTQEPGCYLYPCAVAAGAELYTAYIQNMLDSGDVDGKNTHRLYVVAQEDETKEVSIPQGAQIMNMCSGMLDKKPCLVCELDTDGNMDTNTDREIYLYDFQAEKLSRITDDSETDTMPVIADSGNIYWFRNREIMKLSGTNQTPKAIWNKEQAASQTAFTVATDESGKDTILWEMVDPDAEDGSVTIFQTKENSDGSWGNIVKFTETTGTIASSISATDSGNGLQVAHTEGVFLSDGTELKDLCVTAGENTTDIAVTYIDFEEEKAAAGSPLPLKIDIENNGNTTVDEVEVRVNDTVITTLSDMDLKPFENKEFEITGFSVPESLKKPTQFTLTLVAPSEKNQEDNTVDFLLGCSDVYVDTDCRISEERTWLDIQIWNNTTYESSGKVVVHKASKDGEIIYSKAYKDLGADNGYAYSVDLGDYENEDTKYYVEIATDDQENSIGNNTEFVYIGYGTGIEEKTEDKNIHELESIILDHNKVSLGIGNATQLLVKDELGNTLEQGELLWSSSDKRIASVDQTGLVKAHRTGQAQITAYYGDLSCSCTVTVGEGSETQTFTIWFDTQGGEEIAPITEIASGSIINLPYNVTKLGYIFDGWYTQPNGGERIKSGTMTVTQTMTLYAHWMEDEDLVDTENQGDGLWISGIDKNGYSYLGEAIKPTIRVYDKTTLLTEKTDYTISYKNNINVGKATITVTGKGNYSGKETATFNILPADISGDDFSAEEFYVKIGKKAQSPIPELYYMGTKLKHKKDFTIKYANTSGVYAQTGAYSATITGKGNYAGTREIKLTAVSTIPKKSSVNIAKASLVGFEKSFPYTGKAHKQECTLYIKTAEGEKALTEGADYTVRYANNTKAGTATVTYSGKNNYTGKLKKTYKITPYNISDDYEAKISYENYFESVYAKGGSKPKPVITFDGRVMMEGVDYTLSYKNNKEVYGNQTPCIIVNGKGSFKGKIQISFSINPQDLSKMTLVSCDKVYKNKAGNHKIVPKLMDLDGKLLSAGKDFDKNNITYTYENDITLKNGIEKKAGDPVADTDILPADTQIRVTFSNGTGNNYTGTFTGVYRIVKADIKSAKVTIPNQTYTGKEIILDKSQITVALSGTTLKPEDYDILQYTDNVKKGKASVAIKGNGNYGGTKTAKFTIGTKGFLWWWRKN